MARRAVLVHGAWHGSWAWEPVLPLLRERDIDPVLVDLPSAGKGGGLHDDLEVVRQAVLADDRDTVLVGHSYGGVVITEAARELPSVRHLVYVCAFMLDAGESVVGLVGGVLPGWQELDPEQGVVRANMPDAVFCGDLPSDLAAEYSARLTPQTAAAFTEPLSGAAWRSIGSTYLICDHNQAIPPEFQRMMSQRATHRIEITSSHTPMASHPQVVADLITNAQGGAHPTARLRG